MLSRRLLISVLFALIWTSVTASFPLWRNLLTHHPSWLGRYVLNEDKSVFYDCSLHVVSLDPKDSSGFAIVTADHIDIDMKIFDSNNDTVIHLKEEAVWKKANYFSNHTHIKITGEFTSDDLYYIFHANVSSAEENNFATMALRPRGSAMRNPYHHQSHLNYAVVYGVPLSCAAVLMVSGIAILFWAARKGYIRSLSWSYKSFSNPREESQPPLELRGGSDKTASVA